MVCILRDNIFVFYFLYWLLWYSFLFDEVGCVSLNWIRVKGTGFFEGGVVRRVSVREL